MGEYGRALETLTEVRDRATAAGDELIAALPVMYLSLVRWITEPGFGSHEMLAELERAAPVVEAAGHEFGIAKIHDGRAFAYSHLGQSDRSEREALLAIEHARRAGDGRTEVEQYWYLAWALERGPTRVEAGIARCLALLREPSVDAAAEAHLLYALAGLEARRRRFAEGRELTQRAAAIFEEIARAASVKKGNEGPAKGMTISRPMASAVAGAMPVRVWKTRWGSPSERSSRC